MLTHPSRLYFRETRAEGAAHISFVAHLPQHLMQHDPVGTRHPACLCLTQERPEHSYMRKEFFEMSDCAAGKDERAAAAVAFPFAGLRYPRQRFFGHMTGCSDLAAENGEQGRFALVQIGRASCRESVCQYVWISVVAVY